MLSELWRASEYSYSRAEAAAAYFRCSGSLFSFIAASEAICTAAYMYILGAEEESM